MNDLLEDVKKSLNSYETKDFYIASYLKAKGFKIVATDKKGAQVYFSFENSQAAHEAVKNLFRNNESIGALEFISAIKNIKSIIHNI